ncbi:MgtC/SapB family protein [Lacrimispora sp. AGF001]|uniref:MgtC/SapB family protein n=1 Tax=Lacrimispora sp. AGF001 TaxID=3401631 RepID=UPI003B4351F8
MPYINQCSSYLQEINIFSIIVRLGMSLIVGGILGTERGLRNRPAGFMTYVLVCIGSTMVMLTNQYIAVTNPGTDPTRLAAQVVSGIGFLGAGTIIVTRNDEIRGLTTAAGLWLAAGLGIAIGTGFYSGAVIGMFFSVFALIVLKKVDIYIKQHAKSMEVYLEHNSQFSLRKLSDFACEHHFVLYDMQRGKVKTLEEEFGTLIFTVGTSQKFNHSDVLEKIYTLDGIEYVREIS